MKLVSKQSLVVCGTEWILIVVIVQKTETAHLAVMVMVGRSTSVLIISHHVLRSEHFDPIGADEHWVSHSKSFSFGLDQFRFQGF